MPGKGKPFEKGREHTGGRIKGQQNYATLELKKFLSDMFDEKELAKRWKYFWNHPDPAWRWKAFELLHHYRFGKPVQPVVGDEISPPVRIDVSAVHTRHVKA